MSNVYENDDFDQEQSDPGNLRKAVEKANKAASAKDAELAQLRAELNEVKLGQVFTEKNVPAALQRLMKAEKVEASPEAVDKWLTENGSDFGWAPQAASTQKPEGQQVPPQEAPAVQSVLDEDDIAALGRIDGVAVAGSQTDNGDRVASVVSAVESQLPRNARFEDVVALLQAQGVEMTR